MKETIIKKEDFISNKWDGGETSQLIIYPKEASLGDRNFLWRISSATFTSTESKFSDFTGYQRYILPLEGNLSLLHQGLYSRDLDRYEVEYFDGSWSTYSKNSLDCRDYNFIIKSGTPGKLQILSKDDEYIIKGAKYITLFSTENFTIELSDIEEKRDIEGFSLYTLETKDKALRIINTTSPIILTEVNI